MKTFTTSLLLLSISLGASAKMVKFEAADDQLATQVCLTAATQGLPAAKDLLKENGISYNSFNDEVLCNGKPLDKFARKAYRQTQKSNNAAVIKTSASISQEVKDNVTSNLEGSLEKRLTDFSL